MKERILSTQDICKIIATCNKNGVVELTLGELHLILASTANSRHQSTLPADIPREPIDNSKVLEQLALDEEKDRTSLLVLEDPLEMERRIGDGELIDEADPN